MHCQNWPLLPPCISPCLLLFLQRTFLCSLQQQLRSLENMPSALCTPLHIDNRLCFLSNSCHTASCPRSRPSLRFTHTRELKHLRLRRQTNRVQKSADVVATVQAGNLIGCPLNGSACFVLRHVFGTARTTYRNAPVST